MKKHTVLYLCLGAFLLTLTAFGANYIANKSKSPKEVVVLFHNAVDEKRYDDAKQYGTDATDDFLELIKVVDTEPYDPAKKKTIKVLDEKIIDKTNAEVTYILNGDKSAVLTLKLVNSENEGWLVVYTKDDN